MGCNMARKLVLLFMALHSVVGSEEDSEIDETQEWSHVIDSLDLLMYSGLLVLTIITLWTFKHKRIRFLHESGLAVLYGLGKPSHVFSEQSSVLMSNHAIDKIRPVFHMGHAGSSPPEEILLAVNVSEEHDIVDPNDSNVYSYILSKDRATTEPAPVNAPNPTQALIQKRATFNPEIFFYLLLPPIIFNAGYSMRRKQFFYNLGAILTFALLGTVISTFVIGAIMYGFSNFMTSVKLSFLDTLYFGAIVSATDPVTVLAIFHDLHVDATLNGLVLGESLINDAVAIVLCGSIESYSLFSVDRGVDAGFEAKALVLTILQFFTIFLGSVSLGSVMGSLTAALTKFTRIREFPMLETSLFCLMSYSSYLFAEVCKMSGIVSVLFCGIFQAHYTYHNLSCESQNRTRQFFEILNFLAENFIFSYIGVSMFTFAHHRFDIVFIVGAFIAIAVARACNIYPLSLLLNLGRRQKISLNFQHMLWFAGLRGAMAFALSVRNTVSEERQIFFTATCLIVIATVVVCGGMTLPLLSLMEVPVGVSEDEHEELLNNDTESQIHDAQTDRRRNMVWIGRIWRGFDTNYVKPLLTNSQPSLMETLPKFLKPVARTFTSKEQLVGYAERTNDHTEIHDETGLILNEMHRSQSLTSGD